MPTCPSCGEPAPTGARFCEACGGPLAGEACAGGCVDCGASSDQIDADRYCRVCGRRQPAPHDHEEIVLAGVIAVTDRGITHHRNEDAYACGVADAVVAVMVSDGVSSTADSDAAAIAATAAARDHVMRTLATSGDVVHALVEAMALAQRAAAAIAPSTPGPNHVGGTEQVASCTAVYFAARQVAAGEWRGAVAWLGDSRAYLYRPDLRRGHPTLEQLTVDHSWATEQIALGMTPEAALADPRGHSITRWLGADAVDTEPSLREVDLVAGDVVLVVSDGLWNYVPDTASFEALLAERGPGNTIDSVRSLVAFANEQGGHDNITVAVATF